MVDWSDPGTFWLNVINSVLGIVTIIGFVAVIGAVLADMVRRARKRAASTVEDIHILRAPVLGVTMADGGEKTDADGDEADGYGDKAS